MKKRLFLGIWLLLTVSLAFGASWLFDFEGDELGKPPRGFFPAQTAGRGQVALWKVIKTKDAPSGEKVVLVEPNPRTNRGSCFNLLLHQGIKLRDLEISVFLRAVKGREDQGGGLVWRAKDPDNYYVVRWNPLEDNFRLYYVKDGHRHLLKSSAFKAPPTQWHEIKVIHQGSEIKCFFDGKLVFTFTDETFTQAGRIGLWTKADASTAFDQLMVLQTPSS